MLAAGLSLRAALGVLSIRAQSPTYDEPPHLAAGMAYWRTGDLRLSRYWHPPLASLAAGALPALSAPPLPEHPDWDDPGWKEPGFHFFFAKDFLFGGLLPNPDRLMALGRASLLALTSLLPILVFAAARAAGGPAAGAVAFVAAALCPALTGHGALVTADAVFALFFFAAFAALWGWDRTRRDGWAAAAGLALALALCAKATAAPFLPLPLGWIAVRAGRKAARPALFCAAAMAAAVLAVYRFQAPLLLETLRFTAGLVEQGRSGFVLGKIFDRGVWYYFPAAVGLKTPVAVLIGWLWTIRSVSKKEAAVPALLWAPGAVLFLLACASPVQIGHRHILAAYPFLYVSVGLGLAPLWKQARGRLAVAGLGIWTAVAAAAAAPFPIAYFNELAGGTDRGHRFLVDSNGDWGQGLKALKAYLDKEGVKDFYFSYFGSVDPRLYGLSFLNVASYSPETWGTPKADPPKEKKTFLVVSATNLRGVYYEDPRFFAWLRPFRPDAVLAGSLLVYDVTGKAGIHRWLSAYFRRDGRADAAEREARWAETPAR